MEMKHVDWDLWIPSVIIGFLGAITLFIVNLVLNRFVFKVKTDLTKSIITALVFLVVFAIVSRQWDKKTKN